VPKRGGASKGPRYAGDSWGGSKADAFRQSSTSTSENLKGQLKFSNLCDEWGPRRSLHCETRLGESSVVSSEVTGLQNCQKEELRSDP